MTALDTTVDRLLRSEREGDRGTLRALLAEDFLGVGPRGSILDRDGWVARHDPGGLRYTSVSLSERASRDVGGAAVVTGRLELEGSWGLMPLQERLRVSIVGRGEHVTYTQMSRIADLPHRHGVGRTRTADLPAAGASRRFEGADHGATVSLLLTHQDPGSGPGRHRHPYDETFILLAGDARFTVDDEGVAATAGDIVTVPAGAAHAYVVTGHEPLHKISVHAAPRMVTERLDEPS